MPRTLLFDLEDVSYSRAGKLVLRDLDARLPVGASSIVGPSTRERRATSSRYQSS